MNITPEQLQDRLLHLPDEIYKVEKKALKAKEELEMSKIDFDVRYSMALLKAQKANATEKKAAAVIESQEAKKELLQVNIKYERANALLTAKNNEFIAIRKVSSIEESLIKSKLSGN